MKNLNENYKRALNEAKELPSHINGELQPHYNFFREPKKIYKVMYSNELTPVTVFEALNPRYSGATKFYIRNIPTYMADGNLKKAKDWDRILMYHKAYSRNDIEVKSVNLDIVGIKRLTSKLGAGVLISNVKFIIS